jgi:hypothetical protein
VIDSFLALSHFFTGFMPLIGLSLHIFRCISFCYARPTYFLIGLYLCRASMHSFFIDCQSLSELRITSVLIIAITQKEMWMGFKCNGLIIFSQRGGASKYNTCVSRLPPPPLCLTSSLGMEQYIVRPARSCSSVPKLETGTPKCRTCQPEE